jgi:hypothetical protein
MSTIENLKEKFFTIREPKYQKKETSESIKTEQKLNQLLNRQDIETTAIPKNIGDLLVLFIHGYAASKYCWTDPDIGNMGWVKNYNNEPDPKDYGWHAIPPPPFVPVGWTLSEQIVPDGATTIMDQNDIAWLTYSQQSAFGDINESVEELKNILQTIKKVLGKRRIMVISHSRGGLITKSYLNDTKKTPIEKFLTFGTPFKGTFMSAFETFQLPSKYFLNKIKSVRKLWDLDQERRITTISTRQMAPGSEFLQKLSEKGCRKDVEYITVAGSSSHITDVYTWQWPLSTWKRKPKEAKKEYKRREVLIANDEPPIKWHHLPEYPRWQVYHWILKPQKVFEIYPRLGYKEILQGDGAVSINSALLDLPEVKYYIIPRNHIDMTCCASGKEIMLKEAQALKD